MLSPFDKLHYYTDTVDTREGNIVSTEEKRLTLAYEGLSVVPENLTKDYGEVVEILDLTSNKLTNVDFLESFKKLTTVILDHNYLTSEVIFPTNPNLTTLWVNHNFIEKLHPFIQGVQKAFPNLKFLSLMGNICAPSYLNGGTYYEYIQYRLFVISWLPQLQYLDDRMVTPDQRSEATRLFGRSFYKTLLEEQIPELMERIRSRLRRISFGSGVPPSEEHEFSDLSTGRVRPAERESNSLTSIPMNPQPIQLNSSDSDSSLISLRRRQESSLN